MYANTIPRIFRAQGNGVAGTYRWMTWLMGDGLTVVITAVGKYRDDTHRGREETCLGPSSSLSLWCSCLDD